MILVVAGRAAAWAEEWDRTRTRGRFGLGDLPPAVSTTRVGALRPESAYRYLGQFPDIQAVVVGVSRREHAVVETLEVRRYLPWLTGAAPTGDDA